MITKHLRFTPQQRIESPFQSCSRWESRRDSSWALICPVSYLFYPRLTIQRLAYGGSSKTTWHKEHPMMNFISRLPSPFNYQSQVWHESSICKGVRFATRQISLSGRIELTRRIQDLVFKNEFLRAGDALERSEACLADLLA